MDPNDLPHVVHMQHVQADSFPSRAAPEPIAYYRISDHYKYVMQQIFDCWQYPKLIILEDDMQLAVDFFSYFEAGAALLDTDPSLYCISSWNDHGQAAHAQDALRLERSDFFPGLGWMLTNTLWQSLRTGWPAAYWDDWMRLSSIRQGRQCIRPEVCRTYNFGEKGSSHGQFYNKFLKPIKLNDMFIDWAKQDLRYLDAQEYDQEMNDLVASATLVDAGELHAKQGLKKLVYHSRSEYEKLAGLLGVIGDWKDGVPRASYKGMVKLHVEQANDNVGSTRAYMLLVPANGTQFDDNQQAMPRKQAQRRHSTRLPVN